jgi:hypothetical protein
VLADEDVGRLEVAVHHAALVRVGDGIEHGRSCGRRASRSRRSRRSSMSASRERPSTRFIARNGSPVGQRPAS